MDPMQIPRPGNDIAQYLREFYGMLLHDDIDPQDLIRHGYAPEATVTVNTHSRTLQQRAKELKRWRMGVSDYQLRILDTVASSNDVAVRYKLRTGLLWRLGMETERCVFYRLDPQGRISEEHLTERTSYVWRDPASMMDADSAGHGGSPRPKTGVTDDVTSYLTQYNELSDDESMDAQSVFDMFHTEDAMMRVNHRVKTATEMVEQIRRFRRTKRRYDVSVEQSVVHEGAFAVRYTLIPINHHGAGPRLNVSDFGRLAADGRIRRMVTHVQTENGAWST